jgi:predicted ATP-grasp superfamily ATP-dependent carboligase
MRIANTSTPVVALKSVAHGGLGLVRSLGRLGIDAYTVDANRWTPAFFSRYNSGSIRLDVETAPATTALAELQSLARRIGRQAVLIPSPDYAAIFMADHYESLKRWFIFPEQSPDLLRSLYSKREMYFLAKQHGVPTPEAVFPASRQDVLDFLPSARFPLVLKAIDGTRLSARCGKKMFIVNSAKELLAIYDEIEEPGRPNLMLQEYIAGVDDSIWMFNGYFNRQSECLVSFTGKKLRQCPAFSGYTCFGACLRNDVVLASATRFLQALNYTGMVDIDFCYDPRDGQYKMLDVNPRLGATFRLFTGENGLDLARAYYLDMTGQRVPPSVAREGRKWIVRDLDFASSLRYYKRKQLTASEWIKSLFDVEESAYFAADDPLPLLVRIAQDIVELGKRARHKVPVWGSKQPMTDPFSNSVSAASEVEVA